MHAIPAKGVVRPRPVSTGVPVVSRKLEAKDVREAAHGRWLEVLGSLCADDLDPAAISRPGKHVTCPVHGTGHKGGHGDGFRLFRKDAHLSGGGICNSCGAFPDGFKLLMWMKGWTFPESLEKVADVLGISDGSRAAWIPKTRRDPPVVSVKRHGPSDDFVRKLRREAWAGSVPLTDPAAMPVHRFLAKRGLSAEPLVNLKNFRFHPALDCIDEDGVCHGEFPTLLAGVSDADGNPANLHRTYLTPDGDKAPVPEARMMMPVLSDQTISGGCIRIGEVGSVLGVAEGLETALAVILANGMPVWSMINATLMEKFEPPAGVEQLIIWADLDRNDRGKDAAIELQRRAWEMGIKAQVLLPSMPIPEGKKGVDWNDVWYQHGKSGFPRPAAAQQPLLRRALRAVGLG